MQVFPNQSDDSPMGKLLCDLKPGKAALYSTVRGTVVQVCLDGAWVDVGGKTESLLSREETDLYGIKIGDTRSFFVVGHPDENGQVAISLSWDTVSNAAVNNTTLQARITGLAKSKEKDRIPGVTAEINGLSAFIPSSKLPVRGPAIKRLINTIVSVKVLSADVAKRRIVLSQLDAEAEEKAQYLSTLAPGDTVTGTVTNVTDFGVFLALGKGLSGLLHRSEITGNRFVTPQRLSRLMPAGRQFAVRIKSINQDQMQVSLALVEAPQAKFLAQLAPGMIMRGLVDRVTSFGAFIELDGCIDGLLHNSGLGAINKTAEELLSLGQEVEVVVLHVNQESLKVSLALASSRQI